MILHALFVLSDLHVSKTHLHIGRVDVYDIVGVQRNNSDKLEMNALEETRRLPNTKNQSITSRRYLEDQ